MNWNSGFGVGNNGVFGAIGANLEKNPFGGYGGLNVGGFTGSAPSYGGASSTGGFSPGMGFLTAANSAIAGMQQANLNTAAQNQFAAQNAMFGANFGKDILAQNWDRSRSLQDPIRAAQIATDVGPYRRSLTRANLPDLAGKYGSFGAFSYSPV
jgi:hypothetical protein